MKKINFRSISSRLTNNEMKRVYAGSGGSGCFTSCNDGSSVSTVCTGGRCTSDYNVSVSCTIGNVTTITSCPPSASGNPGSGGKP